MPIKKAKSELLGVIVKVLTKIETKIRGLLMIGIYFSGTGNTRHCVSEFLQEYNAKEKVSSIEEENAAKAIHEHEEIIMAYPVQYSNIPKIMKDFIILNHDVWKGKKIFIIATMGLFSGDGSGILARLLLKYGTVVTGGLHLKMPDSISDERVLKRSLENNRKLIKRAELKIKAAVHGLKNGNPPQEGLGPYDHLAGLLGQRLYFYNKTKNYSNKLKIDKEKCIGCGKCTSLCPMGNIHMNKKQAVSGNQCTMCYRCVSKCPAQAITLLGKRVIEQCYIEKYL